MILLDTSVIIAYYLPETFSRQVQTLYAQAYQPSITPLIELEVVSVLSRMVRTQSLTLTDATHAAALFASHIDDGLYTRHALGRDHYSRARTYIARFDLPLKAPDALHLAAASVERLRLITADRQLARNAEALGIAVDLLEA